MSLKVAILDRAPLDQLKSGQAPDGSPVFDDTVALNASHIDKLRQAMQAASKVVVAASDAIMLASVEISELQTQRDRSRVPDRRNDEKTAYV